MQMPYSLSSLWMGLYLSINATVHTRVYCSQARCLHVEPQLVGDPEGQPASPELLLPGSVCCGGPGGRKGATVWGKTAGSPAL